MRKRKPRVILSLDVQNQLASMVANGKRPPQIAKALCLSYACACAWWHRLKRDISFRKEQKPYEKTRFITDDERRLIVEHVVSGLPAKAVAELVNVPVDAVYYWGHPARRNRVLGERSASQPATRMQIMQRVVLGERTVAEVAKEMGVTQRHVRNAIRSRNFQRITTALSRSEYARLVVNCRAANKTIPEFLRELVLPFIE